MLGTAVGVGLAATSASVGLGVPKAGAAEAARTTIVLSPHPDDEAIRLSHYAVIAADRGDKMILVQASDGSATGVRRRLGLSYDEITRYRYREQDSAWSWLTDGRGSIVRLGLPDAGVRQNDVYSGVRSLINSEATNNIEVYVATWHYDRPTSVPADKHSDHRAVVDAARRFGAEGLVVRYAIHPTANQRGTTYFQRTTQQKVRVEGAAAAYQPIGRKSTRNIDLITTHSNRVSR